MNRKMVRTTTLGTLALVAVLGAARPVRAGDAKNPYPTSMAPLDQYLMGRDAEIASARSAVPPSVAKDATVMVLGSHGYETAVEGKNGFVCNVDRSWMDQFENIILSSDADSSRDAPLDLAFYRSLARCPRT